MATLHMVLQGDTWEEDFDTVEAAAEFYNSGLNAGLPAPEVATIDGEAIERDENVVPSLGHLLLAAQLNDLF